MADDTSIPVVEKTTKTEETVKSSGDATVNPLPPPAAAADDGVRKYLAALVFTSYMSFLVFVTIRPAQLPGDTLGMIIGTLNTMAGLVIGYYFGSSSGSTAKDRKPNA